ncbi:uncharacterized protein CXQ87_001376 [Candidozyma duobushaemuli]|uniref:FAD/NAD(P)-binding domain-containing protein n=2 Tax=Candidozyma TaxID=3303203 RepID=A0ABX8I197_9ASCO|nr:uncharacterized protein CXQ87_001376 [[Candida] duobushaemulonis]PVH18449.1 hypothetical protein CXQ87_001376 [[Candida] duobushaemulonis]QWU86986.1 hypothetical protein CA3LBN_001204 [[Candida] haemuloni]
MASHNKEAVALATNILIIGGSYGGLSALVALKNIFKSTPPPNRISITLIEPKAGLLNILGVPRAIVDPEFAKTQYVPLQNLNDLPFDRLVSDDEYVQKEFGSQVRPDNNKHFEITYIQGRVNELQRDKAAYTLNGGSSSTITFDYCVIAAGRNRSWPTSPDAFNYESYLQEMTKFNNQAKSVNKIAVVGAGAVGIEIAGDIKTKHPEKDVMLIHPHEKFPPEPLTDAFKDMSRESLERAGVQVKTGLRVKQELENHDLELTNGDIIEADFTYWCTAFKNNTDILVGDLAQFVSPANNVHVNDYGQLSNQSVVENIFCIGDMVEKPIIKSAGWALYMGRQVANNLAGLIFEERLVEEFPDLTQMPRGMVLVAGNEEIVSELTGEVELNHKGYVEEYKDYCFGKVRVTLGA